MSEDLNPTAEPEVPTALREVDPTKLAALREKLRAFTASTEKTVSGSEAPPEPEARPTAPQPGGQKVPTGKDVDWSEYDLDFSVRHLYPEALLRQTPEGVRWVAMIDEFYSTNRSGKNHNTKVNSPIEGEGEEPLNLGKYLTMMVNSPMGWKIAALLPGESGQTTVLLQRKVPYILPDPKPLATEENNNEVAAPTDEELARAEAAGLDFASAIGLEAPSMEPEAEPSPAFFIKEKLPEQLEGLLNRVNLDLNPGEPSPAGVQPEEITLDETASRGLGDFVRTENGVERVIAPGVENVRQGLQNLLDGPDFGEV